MQKNIIYRGNYMNNEELKLEETMNKKANEGQTIKKKEPLLCPICNEKLMYMEPSGNTLYCKKCEKFFKNNNGIVGKETTDPYTDKMLCIRLKYFDFKKLIMYKIISVYS